MSEGLPISQYLLFEQRGQMMGMTVVRCELAEVWGMRKEETHFLIYPGLQPQQHVSWGYLHFPEIALGEKGNKAFGLFSQYRHHVHQEQTGHHLL